MRGSGKTHIGQLASAALGWPFLDADVYFEEKHGLTVREYVHEKVCYLTHSIIVPLMVV